MIRELPGAGEDAYLAALVGGDLGPRLLPVGSLAGLLWLNLLGRLGVVVPLRRFVAVGAGGYHPEPGRLAGGAGAVQRSGELAGTTLVWVGPLA